MTVTDRGVVHRDFKPHNVIVDDGGDVKVLDFGLARLIHGEEGEPSRVRNSHDDPACALARRLTSTGAFLGTPIYMAPEQHRGHQASVQSDIFSFCVSLYEGLYHCHPFDCSSAAALLESIRSGAPRTPRGHSVPGWLRATVLEGLAPEPGERPATMQALLDELTRDRGGVRRWLGILGFAGVVSGASLGLATLMPDIPVCQASALRWDARRSAAVAAGLIATDVPYTAATWSSLRPQLDAYATRWRAARLNACEAHGAGLQSDLLFDLRMSCLERGRAHFEALADVLAHADRSAAERAVAAVSELPELAECNDSTALTRRRIEPGDPRVRRRVEELRVELARIAAWIAAGQYERANRSLKPVLSEAEQIGYAPLHAEARLSLGEAEMLGGAYRSAETELGRALQLAVASGHEEVAALASSKRLFVQAEHTRSARDLARDLPLVRAFGDRAPSTLGEVLNNIGVAALDLGDFTAAREALTAALAIRRATHGEADPALIPPLVNLGYLANADERLGEAAGHFAMAAEIAEAKLGAGHPHALALQLNRGVVARKRGRLHEARLALAPFADPDLDLADPQHYLTPLADLALVDRDISTAEDLYRRAVDSVAGRGVAPVEAFLALLGLADIAALRRRLPELEEIGGRAVALCRGHYGENHPETGYAEWRFGVALNAAGESRAALMHFERARLAYVVTVGADSVLYADLLAATGEARFGLGDVAAGEADMRAALMIREAALPPASPAIARGAHALGTLLLASGRPQEAVASLRRAVAIATETFDAEHPDLALARADLARALVTIGSLAEGRALATQALAALRARGPGFAAEADALSTWLAAGDG